MNVDELRVFIAEISGELAKIDCKVEELPGCSLKFTGLRFGMILHAKSREEYLEQINEVLG